MEEAVEAAVEEAVAKAEAEGAAREDKVAAAQEEEEEAEEEQEEEDSMNSDDEMAARIISQGEFASHTVLAKVGSFAASRHSAWVDRTKFKLSAQDRAKDAVVSDVEAVAPTASDKTSCSNATPNAQVPTAS